LRSIAVGYVDVARSYGRAEEFVADRLRTGSGVDDVVIGSMWGYTYTADRRLAGLAAEGVTVGLSTSGPAQSAVIRDALELSVDGAPLLRSVQATWLRLVLAAAQRPVTTAEPAQPPWRA
jgi:aryl-alcohol dehydrogenase-like predicted oxidoreductase